MFSVSFLPNCLRFPLSYSYTCTTVLFWLCDQLEIVLYINRIIHVHVCIMLFICYKSLGTIKYIKTKPVYNLLLITSALCAFWRRLHINQSFICMYVPGMKHRFLKGEPEVAKPKISNNSCRYEGGNSIMESDLYGIIDRSFYAMCWSTINNLRTSSQFTWNILSSAKMHFSIFASLPASIRQKLKKKNTRFFCLKNPVSCNQRKFYSLMVVFFKKIQIDVLYYTCISRF